MNYTIEDLKKAYVQGVLDSFELNIKYSELNKDEKKEIDRDFNEFMKTYPKYLNNEKKNIPYEVSNCIFIGRYAGYEIKKPNGLVIIGDNIRNLTEKLKDVIYYGDKMAIGKVLFGRKNPLYEILNKKDMLNIQNYVPINTDKLLGEYKKKYKEPYAAFGFCEKYINEVINNPKIDTKTRNYYLNHLPYVLIMCLNS